MNCRAEQVDVLASALQSLFERLREKRKEQARAEDERDPGRRAELLERLKQEIIEIDLQIDKTIRRMGEKMDTGFSLSLSQISDVHAGLQILTNEAFDNAEVHGFHEDYNALLSDVPSELYKPLRRTILLAKLALISSEIGEAVSALQHGDEGLFAEEVADIVIRVLDLCGTEDIDLGGEVLDKMMTNRKRPYMHGKEC